MHEIYELKMKLLDELGDYAQNGKFSEDDAKNIKNLAGAVDHICNILMDAEEEYSGEMGGMSYQRGGQGGGRGGQGGSSNRGGSYRGSYEGGGSYARNGRGRGSNARRDSMGRYSSERGYSRDPQEMADRLRDLMEDAPNENVRRDIERLMRTVEQM